MREAGLQAIVAGSATDVLLLSGYWPILSTTVAVFTSDGECRLLVPEDEQELAEAMTNVMLTPYKPGSRDKLTSPIQELHAPLGELIRNLGLEHATIGMPTQLAEQPAPYVVLTEFRFSLRDLLSEILPDAAVVSCDRLLDGQKVIRTASELERMRKAMRVARDGFAAAEHALRPGLREAEVASIVQAAFDSSPAAEALERSHGAFSCMSGPNSAKAAAAYARTRQRRLETGDLVMIHANTCGDGMWTDITRTWTVGEPLPRHLGMRSAIAAARAAALAAIHPGAPAREVDAAARQVMAAHGFGDAFQHATGHGVGFVATSGTALPRIHPHSHDVLAAGMTFNIEPAAYFEGYGGMRHCDVVAVTETSVEVLSDF